MKLPYVKWFDNFSKTYGAGLQGVASPSWHRCLWTGVAIRPYAGDLKLDMRSNVRGREWCMPRDFLDPENNRHLKRIQRYMRKIAREEGSDTELSLWEKSICRTLNVTYVPLKPSITVISDDRPDIKEALEDSRDGTYQFQPVEILPDNIGSNRGLLKIMAQEWIERKQRPASSRRIQIYNSDPNIFTRMIKVLMTMMSSKCCSFMFAVLISSACELL